MAEENNNFVDLMIEKSKNKEETKPQKRFVDLKEVEDITLNIRERLQKKEL